MNTRVIPIASDHVQRAEPHEHREHAEHAASVVLKIPLTRRELLRGTGVITGTLARSLPHSHRAASGRLNCRVSTATRAR
jgi:hypothetical protein